MPGGTLSPDGAGGILPGVAAPVGYPLGLRAPHGYLDDIVAAFVGDTGTMR